MEEQRAVDLTDIANGSLDILNFDVSDQIFQDNKDFMQAWNMLVLKSAQTLILIRSLLLLKRKFNISDFDFELILEDFDEENLFGDKL